MKIPDTGRKKALVVVDLQPAFLAPHNRYVVDNIKRLLSSVTYDAYAQAVFHAEKDSIWSEQQDWTAPLDSETHTVAEVSEVLKQHSPLSILKNTRSAFKGDHSLENYLRKHHIEEIHLVGTETNDCVFATAIEAFDLGFPVYVLEECCEATTKERHKLGLEILRLQKMTNNSCLAKIKSIYNTPKNTS